VIRADLSSIPFFPPLLGMAHQGGINSVSLKEGTTLIRVWPDFHNGVASALMNIPLARSTNALSWMSQQR
jgi:hypothetical protein